MRQLRHCMAILAVLRLVGGRPEHGDRRASTRAQPEGGRWRRRRPRARPDGEGDGSARDGEEVARPATCRWPSRLSPRYEGVEAWSRRWREAWPGQDDAAPALRLGFAGVATRSERREAGVTRRSKSTTAVKVKSRWRCRGRRLPRPRCTALARTERRYRGGHIGRRRHRAHCGRVRRRESVADGQQAAILRLPSTAVTDSTAQADECRPARCLTADEGNDAMARASVCLPHRRNICG